MCLSSWPFSFVSKCLNCCVWVDCFPYILAYLITRTLRPFPKREACTSLASLVFNSFRTRLARLEISRFCHMPVGCPIAQFSIRFQTLSLARFPSALSPRVISVASVRLTPPPPQVPFVTTCFPLGPFRGAQICHLLSTTRSISTRAPLI